MSSVKNVVIYKKENEQGTSYMMFLEYQGLRFAKPWGLTKDAKVTATDVAMIFESNVQEELEDNWEELRVVGTPAEWPLPEWITEEQWEKFDY